MTLKADIAMAERAFRQRWPISDDDRQAIMDRMADIVRNNKSMRAVLGASKVLMAADKLNLEDEKPDQKAGTVNQQLNAPVVQFIQVANGDSDRKPFVEHCDEVPPSRGPIQSNGQHEANGACPGGTAER